MAANPIPLDQQLCFTLYSTTIAINRAYKPLLDRLGLTYPQYLVLCALGEEDGRTIGAIADRLSLEPSTITPLVKRLEAAGLASRRRNPADERQVHVHLTRKGRDVLSKSHCLTDTLHDRSGLTAAQMIALNDGVSALRDAVVKPGKP